jgi:hypothetical protein
MSVTDPFDTVRAGLVVGRSFGDAEAYRALASIEEKLRKQADLAEQFYAAFLEAQARAEAAEQRVAALEEALRGIQGWIESEFREGDKEFQVALACRAALAAEECVCAEINTRHCPVHGNAAESGEEAEEGT